MQIIESADAINLIYVESTGVGVYVYIYVRDKWWEWGLCSFLTLLV